MHPVKMANESTFIKAVLSSADIEETYTECRFDNCSLANADTGNTDFHNCVFSACNMSMIKIGGSMHDVEFRNCQMTGADFSQLNKFSSNLSFIDCNLDYAIFTHLKLRGSVFRRCRLFDATFDESDLTAVSFDECNLERTSFYHCNLEKTDFSTACNYTINPNDCKLKKTIFSENGLRGLVSHLNIIIKD